MFRIQQRLFGYINTLAYRLYGPKRTVMVIHPLIRARQSSRLMHLLEADEALSLARAAKFDIVPGPSEPRMGWHCDITEGSHHLESCAFKEANDKSGIAEYVTVKDSDLESDDEMDLDDPLWNNPSVRKQFAESTIVRLDEVDPVWFFGKGKIEEITMAISRMPPRYVFVNASLTTSQIKQLTECFYAGLLSYQSQQKQTYLETSRAKQMVGYRGDDEYNKYEKRISTYIPRSIEVIDRNMIVLEIFAKRANSPIAKLQSDIAKMQFVKINMGTTNLRKCREIINSLQTYITPFKQVPSTIGDGAVKVNNSMYSYTEHREKVDDLLKKLNNKIADSLKARRIHRANSNSKYITIGLVGYTNSGKTQLFNQLIDFTGGNSDHQLNRSRDILFETLGTTCRRIQLQNGMNVMLVDSIGFIKDLPHFVFHAFKSTIDDITSCDVLLHVIDVSHPLSEQQVATVHSTLLDAGFNKDDIQNRIIQVANKIDNIDNANELERIIHPNSVPVSALTGDGIGDLLNVIESAAMKFSRVERHTIQFPLEQMKSQLASIRELSEHVYDETLSCDETGKYMSIDALILKDDLEKHYNRFI